MKISNKVMSIEESIKLEIVNKDLIDELKSFKNSYILNWTYFPFLDKEQTLKDIEQANFANFSNPDLFVKDTNSNIFPSFLWFSNVFSYFNAILTADYDITKKILNYAKSGLLNGFFSKIKLESNNTTKAEILNKVIEYKDEFIAGFLVRLAKIEKFLNDVVVCLPLFNVTATSQQTKLEQENLQTSLSRNFKTLKTKLANLKALTTSNIIENAKSLNNIEERMNAILIKIVTKIYKQVQPKLLQLASIKKFLTHFLFCANSTINNFSNAVLDSISKNDAENYVLLASNYKNIYERTKEESGWDYLVENVETKSKCNLLENDEIIASKNLNGSITLANRVLLNKDFSYNNAFYEIINRVQFEDLANDVKSSSAYYKHLRKNNEKIFDGYASYSNDLLLTLKAKPYTYFEDMIWSSNNEPYRAYNYQTNYDVSNEYASRWLDNISNQPDFSYNDVGYVLKLHEDCQDDYFVYKLNLTDQQFHIEILNKYINLFRLMVCADFYKKTNKNIEVAEQNEALLNSNFKYNSKDCLYKQEINKINERTSNNLEYKSINELNQNDTKFKR